MPQPQRWWFMGVSGSGKTTYARQVAHVLGAEHIELDATYHQPNWTPLSDEEFRSRVRAFVSRETWALDGNYQVVRPLIMQRAQVIVALDLPKSLVMRQITSRTIRRGLRRQELWNGNRESLINLLRLQPEKNMVLWTWTRYDRLRQRFDWLERIAADYGIEFVRVRSHVEARQFLAQRLGVNERCFLG